MTDDTSNPNKPEGTKNRRFLLVAAGALVGLVALGSFVRDTNPNNGALAVVSPPPLRQRNLSTTKIARMGPILQDFKASLPQYTLTALDDKTSPQSQAYDWLANHPNLATLEQWRQQQLFAMATIYFAMDGPNWIRDQAWGLGHTALWLAYGHPECHWYSVWNPDQVCNAAGQLLTLDLEYLKTPSTDIAMPAEVGLLTNLRRISYHVDMEITIDDLLPVQTFDLPYLERISLLSWGGSLPTQIGKLGGQLQSLSLYHNYLPTSNNRKGSYSYGGSTGIPTELGLCTNLMDLAFHNIEFDGVVPTQLGGLTGLNRLSIRGTKVNGNLPTEFGQLTGLIDLTIADNRNLGGSLPPQMGSLTRLSQVSITNNPKLGGKIPSQLFVEGALANNVQLLDLSYNGFNDVLPSEIGLATKLRTMDLQGNQLVGQLPSQLSQLTKLYQLDLQYNKLTGGLPSEMGLFMKTSLRDFNASYNAMTEVLPTELGLLESISSFDMSHNQLIGDLPMEVLTMGPEGRRAKGWELDLSHNKLTGELSGSTIGSLDRLLKLRLNHNKLGGDIPTQFGLLSKMDVLDLSFNNFGPTTLPTQLGMMEDLMYLDVSNLPQVRGPIPSQMGLLTKLIDLDFSNCPGLTGSIPMEFTNLVYTGDLHSMDVTGNPRLAGIIPEGLCQLNTNQTYCYYRESCTFNYACGDLCGCDDVGCFCNNVNIDRNGGPFF